MYLSSSSNPLLNLVQTRVHGSLNAIKELDMIKELETNTQCKGRLPFVPVVRDFCHAIQPEWIFLRLVVPVARPSKTTTLGYRAAHGVQLLYFARL